MRTLKDFLGDKVFIIAEIGNNHNGSKKTALDLIDMAAAAGVDAVKFQTFTGLDIVSPTVRANEYNGWDVSSFTYWYEFLDTIGLKLEDHKEVFSYAYSKGVIPFSTPTSVKVVDFLESIGNEIYKIASMDVTNIPLLKKVASTGKPVIMSTGMATEQEVEKAASFFPKNNLAILHCISDYPTIPSNVNLLSIPFIADRFKVTTGFSDHSLTNEFALASVVLGGRIIEKHITYSRNAPEKAEHHFALEPSEFESLVRSVRQVEQGIGTKRLQRTDSEMENRIKYRRGLHLNRDMKAGEIIAHEHIAVVRPALGADISEYEFFPGKILVKEVKAWTGLRKEDVKS